MTDWTTWLEEERKRIQALILGMEDEEFPSLMQRREPTFKHEAISARYLMAQSAPLMVPQFRAPPTRAEIIKAVWAEAEQYWAERATKYGLVVICPHLGEFDFEQYRAGDMLVWECEGVVVKREPIVTVEIK